MDPEVGAPGLGGLGNVVGLGGVATHAEERMICYLGASIESVSAYF